jgi:hypothetical protein
MNELSQDARALIDSVSGLDEPSRADKHRVRERLSAQLGVAAFASTGFAPVSVGARQAAEAGAGSAAGLAKKSLWSAHVGKLLVAVGLVSGATFAALHGGTALDEAAPASRQEANDPAGPATLPAPSGQVSEAPAPVAVEEGVTQANEAPAAAPTRMKRAARAAEPAQDTLSRELQLLGQAQAALRAGQAERALSLSEQHRKEFPRGVMKEERLGIAALATCTLNPSDVAQGKAFLKAAPASPLSARVRKACGLP